MHHLHSLLVGAKLALGAALACSAPAVAQAQNNVLIIIADDVGVDYIGIYGEGNSPPPTPNLDALARRGILFRNAWSNPICSPTRACINTGRYATRTGVGTVIPAGPGMQLRETTIPEQLDRRNSGYTHAAIGKWHVTDIGLGFTSPNDSGWGHFAGFVNGLSDYSRWVRTVNGVNAISTEYATSKMVDDALAWIGQQSQPWLCYLSLASAHTPYHAPPAHLHTQNLAGLNPAVDQVPMFRAMVEAMDSEIGRLFQQLGPQVMANTTIIFVSDNGTPGEVSVAPFVTSRAKGTPFEGGVNVPLIVAGPTVQSPSREVAALVSTVDLFATALDLAGVATEPSFTRTDSVSIRPYFDDPAAAPIRQFVFAEFFDSFIDFSTIREARYKLIRYRQNMFEIDLRYDLLTDPFELASLRQPLSPTEAAVFSQLDNEMRRLRSRQSSFGHIGAGGCQGSVGEPMIDGAGRATVGASYSVELTGTPPSAPCILVTGGSEQFDASGLRLPFALDVIGAGPGCAWVVAADVQTPAITDGTGRSVATVVLPNRPEVVGLRIRHQWFVYDPGAPGNSLGLVTTRGLRADAEF